MARASTSRGRCLSQITERLGPNLLHGTHAQTPTPTLPPLQQRRPPISRDWQPLSGGWSTEVCGLNEAKEVGPVQEERGRELAQHQLRQLYWNKRPAFIGYVHLWREQCLCIGQVDLYLITIAIYAQRPLTLPFWRHFSSYDDHPNTPPPFIDSGLRSDWQQVNQIVKVFQSASF